MQHAICHMPYAICHMQYAICNMPYAMPYDICYMLVLLYLICFAMLLRSHMPSALHRVPGWLMAKGSDKTPPPTMVATREKVAEGVAMLRRSSSKARPRYSNCRGPRGLAESLRDSLETPRSIKGSLR